MAALSLLRGRAHKVVVVGMPTARVARLDLIDNYSARNKFLREWVQAEGEPYVFLDYDAMSRAAHPPPGGADLDPHYMCAAEWAPGTKVGGGTAQIPRGAVRRVRTTEDGLCSDEMNRNLWQVIFNAVLQPAGGAASPVPAQAGDPIQWARAKT